MPGVLTGASTGARSVAHDGRGGGHRRVSANIGLGPEGSRNARLRATIKLASASPWSAPSWLERSHLPGARFHVVRRSSCRLGHDRNSAGPCPDSGADRQDSRWEAIQGRRAQAGPDRGPVAAHDLQQHLRQPRRHVHRPRKPRPGQLPTVGRGRLRADRSVLRTDVGPQRPRQSRKDAGPSRGWSPRRCYGLRKC